jgi:hypothetical protein
MDPPPNTGGLAYMQRHRERLRLEEIARRQGIAEQVAAEVSRDVVGPFDHLEPKVALKAEQLRAGMLDELGLDNLPDPEWLIDGILMRDSLAVLYGHPGSAKSFAAIDLSLCVSTGSWWHANAVQQGPVVYIAAEGGSGMKARKDAWKKHHRTYQLGDVKWLPIAVNMLDSEWSAALVAAIALRKPALVVIDTLSRTMPGGNENAPEVMSRWVDNADRIRQATGATVLIIHHQPRDGKNPRGHTSLEGAVATAIECSRNSETIVTLTNTKQKEAAEFEPLKLAMVEAGESCALDANVTAISAASDETMRQGVDILRVLFEIADTNGVSTTTWLDCQTGVAVRTFYRWRTRLVEKGFAANVGTDKQPRYTVTDKGKRVLDG